MPVRYDIQHTTIYRYRQPVRFGEALLAGAALALVGNHDHLLGALAQPAGEALVERHGAGNGHLTGGIDLQVRVEMRNPLLEICFDLEVLERHTTRGAGRDLQIGRGRGSGIEVDMHVYEAVTVSDENFRRGGESFPGRGRDS